jgi:transposase
VLIVESIKKVRLKFHRKGESIAEIVRSTGLARNTVRSIIRGNHTSREYERKVIHAPKLGVFKLQLEEWITENQILPKKERSSIQKLCKRLQAIGYSGGYDSVRRHVKAFSRHPQLSSKAFIPLVFAPGEAYQFDWSQETVILAGIKQVVHVAHFRLCYSRKSFLVAYLRESQEMLFDAHIQAFSYFGGIPLRGIYDNMKTAVDLVFVGKERQFNRRFLELMSYYLIEPVACSPASGWEKGQVEKQVQDVRGDVFTPQLVARSLGELNQLALQNQESIEMVRKHPDQKDKTIMEVFNEEKAALQALPVPFTAYIERETKVSSTCLVQIDRNRYSADCHYVNQPVSVRIYADKLVIISEDKVIGEHVRLFGRDQTAYDPWHYVPLLERKPGALRNGAPFVKWDLPESILQMRQALIGKRSGDREFVKILQAIPVHGLDAVTIACEMALKEGLPGGDYVLNLISRLRPGVTVTPGDISVYPVLKEEPTSDCKRYDGLLKGDKSCSI